MVIEIMRVEEGGGEGRGIRRRGKIGEKKNKK
jgi:hypothetical protein